jgi:1,4-dihydroxy-2-naphthoate octaprenyltransferase
LVRSGQGFAGSMLTKLIAFIRLARPHFLLGGWLLYALGAVVARYQGYPIDFRVYWVGQLFVSSIQLMTHFLNEYWDVDTDQRNTSRTPFSGGSGMLGPGGFRRETAFTAALVCLAVAIGAAAWLVIQTPIAPAALAIMALAFVGTYFYSSPPVSLVSTGFGEAAASVLVAGLVPALGHVLQAGRPSPLIVLATAPLVMYHFAMLMAFEYPDFLSDEAAGKRTLLVRLGRRRGTAVHNGALIAGIALAALASFLGLPAQVALAVVISSPLVLLQITFVRRMQRGEPFSFTRLTLVGILIFAVTTYFMAFSFWSLRI